MRSGPGTGPPRQLNFTAPLHGPFRADWREGGPVWQSLAIYNIVAFLMPGVRFTAELFTISMLSGTTLAVSLGDLLVIVAILLLFVEIVKATRIGSKAIVDHGLSLILLLGMLAELIMVTQAATPTFLLLCTLSFVDVIGGFSVTIRSSERDVAFEGIERT
jgi:hypothetical protein